MVTNVNVSRAKRGKHEIINVCYGLGLGSVLWPGLEVPIA